MYRFARYFRSLLLFVLVGWAGVDDYFPTVCCADDSGAESAESVFFDDAGCRSMNAAGGFSPAVSCSIFVDRPASLTGTRLAALRARRLSGASTADHFYALMSLRR
jgi:hypothetical protein